MERAKYKIGQFTRSNLWQKRLLGENRLRLKNIYQNQGMKKVRYWIFKKLGIKMKPCEVRDFLNYRKHQNRSMNRDIRILANKAAGLSLRQQL